MKNVLNVMKPWNTLTRDRLNNLKQRQANFGQHRAMSVLTLTPYLLLQMIFIPTLFCGAIIVLEPYLFQFWRDCILFWTTQLDIPLQATNGLQGSRQIGLEWSAADTATYMPSNMVWMATCLLCLIGFVVSLKMNGRMLPLKYLVRILCTVQAVALAYFLFIPSQFPYSIVSHISSIITIGYVLLIATPVLLAFGYYVLDFSVWIKLKHTILILAFFIVMVPFQIVLHLLILQNFSVMFMPVLYICFGAIFDVLIFVALYSWAASTIPVGKPVN